MKRFNSAIEIKGNNYKTILPLDIVAFSYATGGAMGEGGAVYIITRDSKVYHLNYCDGSWKSEDQLNEIFPVLKNTSFQIFGGGESYDGWYVEGLGAGNWLILREDLKGPMAEMKTKHAELLGMLILYQLWDDFVLEILDSGLIPTTSG